MVVIKSENLLSYTHCSILLKLIDKSVLLRSVESIAKIYNGPLLACPIDAELIVVRSIQTPYTKDKHPGPLIIETPVSLETISIYVTEKLSLFNLQMIL